MKMLEDIKFPFYCGYWKNGYAWFRFWGYGLHFKNIKKHPISFSDRYGYSDAVFFFNIQIKSLKP